MPQVSWHPISYCEGSSGRGAARATYSAVIPGAARLLARRSAAATVSATSLDGSEGQHPDGGGRLAWSSITQHQLNNPFTFACAFQLRRSEERRVGKECRRWWRR